MLHKGELVSFALKEGQPPWAKLSKTLLVSPVDLPVVVFSIFLTSLSLSEAL